MYQNMHVLFFCCMSLICILCSSQKHDVVLTSEKAELVSFNPALVHISNFTFRKYNRTTGAGFLDVDLFVDIVPDKSTLRIAGYKLLSNQYRLTVLQFTTDLCTFRDEDAFSSIFKNGNVTKCPISKGKYYLHEINPDIRVLPPGVPQGRWKMEVELRNNGRPLATINWFIGIDKAISWKK